MLFFLATCKLPILPLKSHHCPPFLCLYGHIQPQLPRASAALIPYNTPGMCICSKLCTFPQYAVHFAGQPELEGERRVLFQSPFRDHPIHSVTWTQEKSWVFVSRVLAGIKKGPNRGFSIEQLMSFRKQTLSDETEFKNQCSVSLSLAVFPSKYPWYQRR